LPTTDRQNDIIVSIIYCPLFSPPSASECRFDCSIQTFRKISYGFVEETTVNNISAITVAAVPEASAQKYVIRMFPH
jgi:hypothetical protein